MFLLLATYIIAAAIAPYLVARFDRRAFLALAAVPAAGAVWGLAVSQTVFRAPIVESLTWIPALGLDLAVRLDPLSWLLYLIIQVVGALVLLYCSHYFPARAIGLKRFACVFVAFAGAMTAVVLADHTIGLYIAWEATSLLSFLLIGHHHAKRYARAAARQAFLVTTTGSLAMLAGFVILGEAPGGTYRLSSLVDALAAGTIPPSAAVTVAMCLLVAGAVTKSALIPTHFWLPQAMAAPTPVSAFLHAAAMVKAGVYLVLRLSPGAAHYPGFTALLTLAGLGAVLLGGYRALRQTDLKLILAYGTISQLGLIIAIGAQGDAASLAAAQTLVIAHATFKSALFLTTGTIEKIAGTRDLRELSGLKLGARRLAVTAAFAGASMAGFPLTGGYLGKEAALTHYLAHGWPIALALIIGSILTVAYTLRYWWGAFGIKGRTHDGLDTRRYTRVSRATLPVWIVPAMLAFASVAIGFVPHTVETVVDGWAGRWPGSVHLAWWSGVGPAAATLLILLGGWVMYRQRPLVARWQRRLAFPNELAAATVYTRSIGRLEDFAAKVTTTFHRGSLPLEIAGILVTICVATGAATAWSGIDLTHRPVLTHSSIELIVAVLTVAAAFVTVTAQRRLYAALALGAVGAGVSMLFLSFGAPDLALTQLVVEAITIVVFVLALRRLPGGFPGRGHLSHQRRTRWMRAVLASLVGAGVTLGGLLAAGARVHSPISRLLPKEAREFGYGDNIVNVILVDVRAWDTMGELSVVLVMAVGVASLVYVRELTHREERANRARRQSLRREARRRHEETRTRPLLATATLLPPQARSVVFEMTVRVLFHTLLIVSLWLLIIGHNSPGGGFVGGGLAGIALIVRYLAGGRTELLEAVPFNPGRVLGTGLFVAALGGAWPLLAGKSVFQTVPFDLDLGWAGHIHATSAMLFDIGVYIVIIGMILDIIAAQGGHVDADPETPAPSDPDFTRPLSAQGSRP